MLSRDKKGVSEMVGYVLLVVIGISLGVIVYGFLKLYIPPQKVSCPSDVALSIEELSCGNEVVSLVLRNRGLFSVDGAYIRIGEANRVYRDILNEDNILFPEYYPDGLPPDGVWPEISSAIYPYSELGERVIEIEPVMFIDNERILCDRAIITQTITCGNEARPLDITLSSPTEGGQYNEGESIPLTFTVSGDNRNSCWYTLDSGVTNVSLPGCLGIDLMGLSAGPYNVQVYLNDILGDEVSDGASFTITSQGLIINIDNPIQDVVYEYSNLLLSLPIGFSVANSPDSCSARIFNASNTGFGPTVTSCTVSRTLNQSQINFPRDDNYYLNVNASKGSERVFLQRRFGILASPRITINSPPPVQGCNVVFDFTPKTRKNPISFCDAYLFKDNIRTGLFTFVPCIQTSYNFPSGFDDGNYRIDMYVNDSANPMLTGFDTTSFTINSGCSGFGSNGGWLNGQS